MEKLRKFGLEHCDLPTMLWNVTYLLRLLTLDIDNRYKKKIPKILYVIFLIIIGSYFYVYLVSMVWFVFWRCRETGDLIAATIVFSLGLSSEIGNSKLFFMFFYKDEVRKLVDGYLACDALRQKGSRFSQNLLTVLRSVKKRAIIFWLVVNGNGVIYIAKAILLPGRHLMEDDFLLLGLEPILESPNYEIAFLLTTLGVFHTCYLPSNITAFYIVLIGYTEATMLALSEELNHLWGDAQRFYNNQQISNKENASTSADIESDEPKENLEEDPDVKKFIMNKYISERLHEIAKIHVTNINLIMRMEHVFCGAIALEFVLLMSGLIAELLGGLENTYIEMPFALMQVAMDCLTGQRMMDACITFENSVYDCKWENFDVANKKTVLLMLQNAQKTMVLSAGGLAKLNFNRLMSIFRSIYSAYTTLRSTMSFT